MSIPPLPPGLEASPTADLANRLHSLAIHLLRRVASTDRESGLTPERLSLLSVVVFGGEATVSQLAAAERVSAAAISRSLTSLEALGLVERRRAATAKARADARLVTVRATRAGRALMDECLLTGQACRRVLRVRDPLSALSALLQIPELHYAPDGPSRLIWPEPGSSPHDAAPAASLVLRGEWLHIECASPQALAIIEQVLGTVLILA